MAQCSPTPAVATRERTVASEDNSLHLAKIHRQACQSDKIFYGFDQSPTNPATTEYPGLEALQKYSLKKKEEGETQVRTVANKQVNSTTVFNIDHTDNLPKLHISTLGL